MIHELILELLLQRYRVLLEGVGVIYLQRHWAQFSQETGLITPPFDNLVIEVEGSEYDIDIVEAVSQQNGVEYDLGYRVWCDYLAMEAIDGLLTIEGVAMVDINQLSIVALDPQFAEQLSPDVEPMPIAVEVATPMVNQQPVIANQRRYVQPRPQKSGIGGWGYFGITIGVLSALYLAYFFLIEKL